MKLHEMFSNFGSKSLESRDRMRTKRALPCSFGLFLCARGQQFTDLLISLARSASAEQSFRFFIIDSCRNRRASLQKVQIIHFPRAHRRAGSQQMLQVFQVSLFGRATIRRASAAENFWLNLVELFDDFSLKSTTVPNFILATCEPVFSGRLAFVSHQCHVVPPGKNYSKDGCFWAVLFGADHCNFDPPMLFQSPNNNVHLLD